MSKPARGTKRVCPSCGARFYDLNRTPIVCPVCQSIHQMTPPPSRRWERAQPAEARKVEEQKADAPVLEGAEIVSLEEAEEGRTSEVPIEDDKEVVGLGDDGAELPAGDDENALWKKRRKARPTCQGSAAAARTEERS
jgi:uncharacterized protein (TIGR02300 family)